MPVTMICPNLTCRQTVVSADNMRGKIVRCAYCGQPFLVPTRESTNPETPKDKDADGKSKRRAF
ncbi:MAG: hypothetical protein AB7Q17_09335 [Phycisphaerae bacterium]